ncbi:hypothetical protein CAEBREN_07684 [Caenorhabditis brenneri]|uniref:F-box domain-containing protein n=1 Tax=Caenorhabditis brenneri TaxID=135651 RepID=G0NXI8_CAEBE|nr:hypothetical protein CAEBREN_07684 [Caenorhabditis brenneri]
MLLPLRRLPFLAIREMIQSMNTREIFYLSLLSKNSQNLVMLSIPKDSLLAKFTFKNNYFQFELMPPGYIKNAFDYYFEERGLLELMPAGLFNHQRDMFPDVPYKDEFLLTRVSTDSLYVQCDFRSYSDNSEVEESIRKLFDYFSNTFKKSEISIEFGDGTREEFAIEILRFAWENDFKLDRIYLFLHNASSQSFQELLNWCNEQHTFLHIRTKAPMGFKCTPPPGGYKFKSLLVHDAHWVNLDDFMQCREFRSSLLTDFPDLTVEYLNDLLKKIVNMECKFENFLFKLDLIETSDFPEIVRGLSERILQFC